MVKKSKQTSSEWDGTSDGIQNTGDFKYSFADLDDDLGMTTNTVDPDCTYLSLIHI